MRWKREKVEIFEVIHPSFLTTIQDLGRYGYQQYGVPVSGAMDNYALRVANLLVGNSEGDAALEITLPGLRLKVLEGTIIAITGADLSPNLNNNLVPMWRMMPVSCGDTISFSHLQSGCRSYLAVAGGIDVPEVLKSRSTYINCGIGGLDGRPLCSGDHLMGVKVLSEMPERILPSQYIPEYRNQIELRVILGPQDNLFTRKGIQTFLHSEYTVSHQADRIGYRLDGPCIEHKDSTYIIPDGLPLGAVQVPGNGLPIVLLVDRPTTGGYTKIATVITTDILKLVQSKPGDRVRFRLIEEEEAYLALKQYEQSIQAIRQVLASFP